MSSGTEKVALFPGTFDPITNGHLDIIRRSEGLFDRLVVAVGINPAKQGLFSTEERLEVINRVLTDEGLDIEARAFDGLTVDFARQCGARVIVRGLRNAADLAHEFQLALTNRAVADIETIFIMSGEPYGYTSSSLIKEIAAAGQVDRLGKLLPAASMALLKKHLGRLTDGADRLDANQQ